MKVASIPLLRKKSAHPTSRRLLFRAGRTNAGLFAEADPPVPRATSCFAARSIFGMDASMDNGMDASTDGRWMTYAELAEARGIDKASALKLAFRHKDWPRRKNNRGQMQVCVPADWAAGQDKSRDESTDASIDLSSITNRFDAALATLRERAEAADQRADRAEQALAGERSRADVLRERLDSQAAELTAARVGQEQAEGAAVADRAARERAEAEARQLREAEAVRQSLGRWARLRAAWRG
jgi:hypothetical protein